MKQFFATAVMISCLSLPASASSIELIDDMVTGPDGTPSIITLGTPVACENDVCVDATGGDSNLATSSTNPAAALNAAPVRKINFDFARKYPDPANPVASAQSENGSDDEGESSPATETADSGSGSGSAPNAPEDIGNIPAQPPVTEPMDPVAMGAPATDPALEPTRGSMKP
jgi:hypothetical protein